MSVTSPTVIPHPDIFPVLLPRPPQPHPTPLPRYMHVHARMNARRDLMKEMDDLSEEDNELDELKKQIKNRGYGFLIPIGKNLTQQEEKNDEEQEDSTESAHSGAQASGAEDADGENESAPDLDAAFEDMDAVLEDMDAEEIAETDEEADADVEYEEEFAVDV